MPLSFEKFLDKMTRLDCVSPNASQTLLNMHKEAMKVRYNPKRWQSMETAPKDGSWVLGCVTEYPDATLIRLLRMPGGISEWWAPDRVFECHPYCWMELPLTPIQQFYEDIQEESISMSDAPEQIVKMFLESIEEKGNCDDDYPDLWDDFCARCIEGLDAIKAQKKDGTV